MAIENLEYGLGVDPHLSLMRCVLIPQELELLGVYLGSLL